jgi:GNAT superfamily N-acetyltransferase
MPTPEHGLAPRVVTDRDELRRFFLRDAVAAAYQLGDLDDAYEAFATWYGAGADGALDAVTLLYTGLSLPAVLTYGSAASVRAIVETFRRDMPGRAIVHMQPDHVEAVDNVYECLQLRAILRMGLACENFLPADANDEVCELGHRDTGEIMGLFRFYPDNFFEPAQLATGHYYGVRRDDRLVSVAGVHVFSRDLHVACLGNVVTHPDYRGLGLSTATTSHLCARLIDAGVEIMALNVARHNKSAVRVYEKLGFTHHTTYLEGVVTHAFEASS